PSLISFPSPRTPSSALFPYTTLFRSRLPLVQVLENRRLLQQLEVHAVEATTRGWEEQVKPWVTWADLLTALRVPLAVAFPFVHQERKSTRLNSSHVSSSYAVCCSTKH